VLARRSCSAFEIGMSGFDLFVPRLAWNTE
jgi:hypothetical protein